ncbi:MAG: RsmE family RNA methyltransferase [Myxococcota bacterium]
MRTVALAGVAPGRVVLDAVASHHLLNVVRLARGERVRVTGGGRRGVGVLVGVRDGLAEIEVGEVVEVAEVARVVVLGAPKPALLEEALTLGTEAGATEFRLVRARRSPPGEPRVERLEKVVRAAVTQCGRASAPGIASGSLAVALEGLPDGPRWVGVPGAPRPTPSEGAATVAVGPEGGWDPGEIEALRAAGFRPAGLGPHVLRTPTAVAVAVALTRG